MFGSTLNAEVNKVIWPLNFQVSPANAEESIQNFLESTAHLEDENSNLMDQVQTLQGSVKNLAQQLFKLQRKYKEKLKVCEEKPFIKLYFSKYYENCFGDVNIKHSWLNLFWPMAVL